MYFQDRGFVPVQKHLLMSCRHTKRHEEPDHKAFLHLRSTGAAPCRDSSATSATLHPVPGVLLPCPLPRARSVQHTLEYCTVLCERMQQQQAAEKIPKEGERNDLWG